MKQQYYTPLFIDLRISSPGIVPELRSGFRMDKNLSDTNTGAIRYSYGYYIYALAHILI